MSSSEGRDASQKPHGEAKRVGINEQEKQRKDKIKKCITEIASELPPTTEHLDKRPVSILIFPVSSFFVC